MTVKYNWLINSASHCCNAWNVWKRLSTNRSVKKIVSRRNQLYLKIELNLHYTRRITLKFLASDGAQHLRHLAPAGQHSSEGKTAAVATGEPLATLCWFDRPGNRTQDLPHRQRELTTELTCLLSFFKAIETSENHKCHQIIVFALRQDKSVNASRYFLLKYCYMKKPSASCSVILEIK